jgi:formate transporter
MKSDPTKRRAVRDLYGFNAYSPAQVAEYVEEIGLIKSRLPFLSTFMLAVVAGGFIGMGGLHYLLVTSDAGLGFTSQRLLGGMAFSLGYILAVLAGGEVFTSNNLLTMTWAARKITLRQLARNWSIVLAGNAVGAAGLALLVLLSNCLSVNNGAAAERALAVAAGKASLPLAEAFFKGIAGNLFVCIGVWVALAGRSVTDKVVAMFLPISAMASAGLEHVAASLFFIPLGIMLKFAGTFGAGLNLEALNLAGLFRNLVPVMLGNVFGGSLMVAMVYYIIYRRRVLLAERALE